MSSPVPIITPPPKKLLGVIPLTADAGKVLRKASTWVAWTAAGIGAYCGASLAAYALTPDEARAAISAAELAWYSRGMMVSAGVAALVPLATSWAQGGMRKP